MKKKIMTLMMGTLLLLTACGQTRDMKIGSMCGWDVPGADPDNCEDIVQRRGGMELG